jgi:hypothetical protein
MSPCPRCKNSRYSSLSTLCCLGSLMGCPGSATLGKAASASRSAAATYAARGMSVVSGCEESTCWILAATRSNNVAQQHAHLTARHTAFSVHAHTHTHTHLVACHSHGDVVNLSWSSGRWLGHYAHGAMLQHTRGCIPKRGPCSVCVCVRYGCHCVW